MYCNKHYHPHTPTHPHTPLCHVAGCHLCRIFGTTKVACCICACVRVFVLIVVCSTIPTITLVSPGVSERRQGWSQRSLRATHMPLSLTRGYLRMPHRYTYLDCLCFACWSVLSHRYTYLDCLCFACWSVLSKQNEFLSLRYLILGLLVD